MKNRVIFAVVLIVTISTAPFCFGWGDKSRTADDLTKIATSGANLVLDASGKEARELVRIAAACNDSGHNLHLKRCGGMETDDLMKIAAAGGGRVTIEF